VEYGLLVVFNADVKIIIVSDYIEVGLRDRITRISMHESQFTINF